MRKWPILVDITCACDEHTDAALEMLHKAMGEEPPGSDIWAEHPNPYLRTIVELFTKRGLERIAGVQEELGKWLSGSQYDPRLLRPTRPGGVMQRWSQAEVAIARVYLQALPPEQWTLDDWLMLIDYLAQRYLPIDDLRSESDWMASRSHLMGRAQSPQPPSPEYWRYMIFASGDISPASIIADAVALIRRRSSFDTPAVTPNGAIDIASKPCA